MSVIGFKEDGVCRIIRTIDIGTTMSNVVSKIPLSGTLCRCALSANGPVIVLALGWSATAQAALFDPDLLSPKDLINNAFLRKVFCPRCLGLLKKRKLLGENENLDPLLTIVLCTGGVFYSCLIKTGEVSENDRFFAPAPYSDAALFGVMNSSDKTGWDLLEQAVDAAEKLSALGSYPLVRIDDEKYVFECKMSKESNWEVCK